MENRFKGFVSCTNIARSACAALVLSLITMSAQSHAQQSMLGEVMNKKDSASELLEMASSPSITGLLGSLTSTLGVSEEQAQGGVASLMNYAKSNLSSDDFSALANQLPGTEGILDALPDIGNMAGESGGLGNLLGQAAQLNEQLGGTALLAQQFESLGLDSNMIMGFAQQIQAYLSTPEGQHAKDLLMQSFSDLQV
ncbi:DUF2780 domain-containing protein [Ningiella sp. W23]|uniref:DUF2780 domain-containing protein n=1 Tax=Ningiella sp. W23 TaxID=3023715 RepID=UPI003756E432